MPTDTQRVLEAAPALPAIDRAEIAETLLASLDGSDSGALERPTVIWLPCLALTLHNGVRESLRRSLSDTTVT